MAENYKVGNLQIAFEAINSTSEDFKKLATNLRAISKLILNITNADIDKFANNINTITNALTPFLSNIKEATEGVTAFAFMSQQLGIKDISKVAQSFSVIRQEVEETTKATTELTGKISSSATGFNNLRTTINKPLFNDVNNQLQETANNLKEVNNQLNKTNTATKKSASGFKKFLKSLGRIALYRAIRRAIQLITQAITETIQEFAKVDDNVNKTMSSITSSLQVIKLSFGSIFLPLLEAIAPILNQIAVAFANFANTISQAMATGDTYWAINAEAIQDYREQLDETTGSLASFDKFNTLNTKQQTSFLEERQIDTENDKVKETQKILSLIQTTISSIGEILSGIWAIAEPILGGVVQLFSAISPLIEKIVQLATQGLSPVLQQIGEVLSWLFDGIIGDIIDNIAFAIQFIVDILNGDFKSAFKDMINFFISPINFIISAIELFINAVILIINNFLDALSLSWTWLNVFGLNLKGIPHIPNVVLGRIEYQDFANGGLPDKGTLFRAGEAGAELVYNTPSGQSGVANVSQLKSAFYQALVEWGNTSDSNITLTVNLDGETVYKNTTAHAKRRGQSWA